MTLKTPQDQQAVNARPTPQWDFAPEGALASSPQVGLGGAGGRALLSSILNTYVQKMVSARRVPPLEDLDEDGELPKRGTAR